MKSTTNVAREISFVRSPKTFLKFLVKQKILFKDDIGYYAADSLVKNKIVEYKIFDNGKRCVYWTEKGEQIIKTVLISYQDTYCAFETRTLEAAEKARRKQVNEYFMNKGA